MTDQLFPGRFFVDSVIAAAETKVAMTRHITVQYLMRAAMAGILIGIFYTAFYAIIATFANIRAGEGTWEGLGRVLGSLLFGWALVFIYFTKSELLTSNMMVTSIAGYYRSVTVRRALVLLGLCYLGNALGGLFIALLLRLSTLISGGVLAQMTHSAEVKVGYVTTASGLMDLLVRAVLCNLMINVAMLLVYNGYVKDTISMCFAMVVSVFLFAFLGLEHSVANTVLFTIVGLHVGIDVGLAAGNVAVALIGNFIGGGLLIGIYYAYVNDNRRVTIKRT